MAFWQYAVLFGVVMIGGLAGYYARLVKKSRMQIVLSFTGAYIFGVTVLHLMPGVFHDGEHIPGLWILLGFFIQLLLDQLSSGVEHGHIHAGHSAQFSFAIPIMIGLSLHAFLEGLPLANYADFHFAHHGHSHNHEHLLIGLILHKLPAAFALVVLLRLSGFSKSFVLICLTIFASMSPLGAALAEILPWNDGLQQIVTASGHRFLFTYFHHHFV
jgi:zinc transporter ZupT